MVATLCAFVEFFQVVLLEQYFRQLLPAGPVVVRQYAQFFPADLLSEAPLAEAYAEGQRLSLDEAVALALGSA